MTMRMNGANHSEESLREAEAFARAVVEGRLRTTLGGKVDPLADSPYLVDILPATLPARIPASVPREKPKVTEVARLVDTKTDCTLATHRWSKPESDGQGVRSSCIRCGAGISTDTQGDAVEVIGDLLRQIPKLSAKNTKP